MVSLRVDLPPQAVPGGALLPDTSIYNDLLGFPQQNSAAVLCLLFYIYPWSTHLLTCPIERAVLLLFFCHPP